MMTTAFARYFFHFSFLILLLLLNLGYDEHSAHMSNYSHTIDFCIGYMM